MIRCDWATVGSGGLWHAFKRRVGPGVKNSNGETQLDRAVCSVGPGNQPHSGIRLGPSCIRCMSLTRDDGVFTVVRED